MPDLESILRTGRSTGYSIGGTSGATVSVGTPELKIEIAVSHLRMVLKNDGSRQETLFKGLGGGIGLGVSISIPFVNASGGPDSLPSVGSTILRGPACPKTVAHSAFKGRVLFITGSAMGIGHSSDVSLVLFLAKLPAFLQAVIDSSPMLNAALLLPLTKGVALCWGLSLATTLGGVGTNAIMYEVIPASSEDWLGM